VLTMRRLIFSGFILGLTCTVAPVAQANDSSSASIVSMAGRSYSGVRHHGGHMNTRWIGGHRAPGGWGGYRRPAYGYVLPRYWVQPSFFIANYGSYGLPRPVYGYGWSRYYNDAVLTDRYGRVYDSRSNIEWDRYDSGYDASYDGYADAGYADGGYYDERQDRRRGGSGGLTGAAVGGVVGGLLGNRIAGHGNRTVGTIMGAGVGAIAGGAIGSAADKARSHRHDDRRYDDRAPAYAPPAPYDMGGYGDDQVTYNGGYNGRWVGTWYGEDGRTYSGEYRGTYRGETPPRPARGAEYDAPPVARPHWSASAPGAPALDYGYGTGYESAAYYAPGIVTTTTVVQPVTMTTTTYVEEEVTYSRPARKVHKAKRVWKPVRCTCR
jgi:Ni/Co efflux regulator RcnB